MEKNFNFYRMEPETTLVEMYPAYFDYMKKSTVEKGEEFSSSSFKKIAKKILKALRN